MEERLNCCLPFSSETYLLSRSKFNLLVSWLFPKLKGWDKPGYQFWESYQVPPTDDLTASCLHVFLTVYFDLKQKTTWIVISFFWVIKCLFFLLTLKLHVSNSIHLCCAALSPWVTSSACLEKGQGSWRQVSQFKVRWQGRELWLESQRETKRSRAPQEWPTVNPSLSQRCIFS